MQKMDSSPTATKSETLSPVKEVLAATSEDSSGALKVDAAQLDPTRVQSATDWFLSPEPQEEPVRKFQLNVGVSAPHWVEWGVRPLDRGRIRDIREATVNRAGRRAGAAPDDMAANVRIAAEGTALPDLSDPEMRKGPDGSVIADPVDVLQFRFRHKPGLIDQIAAEVLAVSGYDDEDVRAAGG